jgi:multidrug efflux system membrane fusion protein
MMTSMQTVRLGAGVFFLLAVAACGDNTPQKAKGPPPPQVTVAPPVKRSVIDRDEYVGRFVAVDSVEIRARVSGYLDAVHFTDGGLVKQGALLFTIDQRPYKAALDQAKADHERAKAQVDFVTNDLTRAQDLVERKTISEAVYEQRVNAKRAADAQLQSAEANVRAATLNLEFTELRSPVEGRIGDRRVSPGNLVIGGAQPSTTLLATVVSTDPIRFEFTFDEASFLRYSRLAELGKGPDAPGTSTQVELRLLDEPDFKHKGKMDFVDNVIDRASGTIRGRAVIPNPAGLFTPGMFARVRVPGSAPFEALLVPDSAIGTEQIRKFVYVVDSENTVQQKYVTLGALDNGLRVVLKGIEPNDRVIVNGLMRARPGIKVTPTAEGERPPGAPAGTPSAAK